MARATKGKPKGGTSETELTLTVRPVVSATEDTPVFYINYAEISHNLNEFSITVARVPTRPSPAVMELARETGTLSLEASAVLLIPPTVAPGLLKALQGQIEAYEQRFGKILEARDGHDDD